MDNSCAFIGYGSLAVGRGSWKHGTCSTSSFDGVSVAQRGGVGSAKISLGKSCLGVGSITRMSSSESGGSGAYDLLIIGCGVLGTRIASLWSERHSDARIHAITGTSNRHKELESMGVIPYTADKVPDGEFGYVVFCVPPSAFPGGYARAVSDATRFVKEGGKMVFTSSTGVYKEQGIVNETSEVGIEGRAGILACAEGACLGSRGGMVVRFSGLYERNRGPHVYWMKKGQVEKGDGTVNLIWYGDAAELVCKSLEKGERGNVYLGCAKEGMKRREIVEVAKEIGEWGVDCEVGEGNGGRMYENEWTREQLEWTPKFERFEQFMEMRKV